ncbi:MAG: ABC transporter permease, partial [Lachnospiraceae bacterium]|nr:ABC transporter permease [Lachnospiraceae bacterium]
GMKRFLTVYEFELKSYMKNKSFVITTIVLAVLLFGAMFLPRVFDMSDMLGIESAKTEDDKKDTEDKNKEDATRLGLVDEGGLFADLSMLEQAFGDDVNIVKLNDGRELEKAVKKEEITAGFDVKDDLHYEYYVLNREMFDENQAVFEEVLSMMHQQRFCEEQGIDYASFMAEYNAPVDCTEQILGKDAEDNYWYCYALVIVIFMMIILYGVMVATSVTVEKSNRSIEVLVTSIDAKYLLFGKVFAGATAAILQLGLILAAVLGGYAINHTFWGDALDMVLDIPGEVLAAFAVFGIGGFLFYAFLYGAMGALVSKTEDINKTAGTLQMVIMIVYFAVLFQLQNPDGIVMKVCSFLPFSSYSAMFVRIGMGTVAMWEIVVSAVILFVSIFGVGWLAAKIYRMGTLRYGNPIKLSTALKNIKGM